jgi:hypothetical protein
MLVGSRWPGAAVSRLDLVNAEGRHSADWTGKDPAVYAQAFKTLREEFVASVQTGVPHPCDARRAADVQVVVDQLRASAAGG